MDELNNDRGKGPGGEGNAVSRDGLINFSGYSDIQLSELVDAIDNDRFPINYLNLKEEIARRAVATEPTSLISLHVGRFTPRDGICGWFQALRDRSPVYGSGSIEVRAGELIVNGWQRSWLAAPVQIQIAFTLDRVRNVTQTVDLVGFEIKSKYWRPMQIGFGMASPTAASALVAELPEASSPGFARQWAEVRDFNSRLRSVDKPPIVTYTLVAMSIWVFVALCVATKRWGQFDVPTLIHWGANFGPLTVNGQWWRLVSALFLHVTLPHLLFNMWALWNVGRLTERLFGRLTFVFLFVSCGLIASLSSIMWNPSIASVGASGPIFGLFGAFLAFFLKPENQVPPAIARRHWVSTSAFVLFSLCNGVLNPGIDNAAHVGGLVGGFALGWLLARPLNLGHRHGLSVMHRSGAAVLVFIIAVMSIWQIKGIGSGLTITEKYLRQHRAYVEGESKNLQLWNELAAKAASGAMSDSELGKRFERDILPFWQAAHAQIDQENLTLQGPQRPYALLAADFVRLRLEWAQKIVDALKTSDQQTLAEAQTYIKKVLMVQASLERFNVRAQMDHRPRALANNPLVTKLRNALTGYRWQCVHKPAGWAPIPETTDNPKDGPSERNRVGCVAQQLFMTGDYVELDSLMTGYALTLADLPDGSSRYEGFVAGLEDLFKFGRIDGLDLLGRTADWRRSVRISHKPDLIEAMIYHATAWSVRGTGSANSVSAQQWSAFAYRTEMAAGAMADAKENMRDDPAWYATELTIALDQGQQEEEIRAIFDDGFARVPNFRPIETAMLRVLMPRWGGSYEKIDQFINDLAQRADSSRRAERYAELYSEYALLEGDDIDLFADTAAYWSRMKVGYGGDVKRYPASDVVLNFYAAFSCRANDGDQYETLRSAIDQRYSSVAWSTKYTREFCNKKFADNALAAEHAETERQLLLNPKPIVNFGGVRLGMTPGDLLAKKGTPIAKQNSHWTYDSVDSRHDGVITAVFSDPLNEANGEVAAVEFMGDQSSAPSELSYLNGFSEEELRNEFGSPIGMASPSEDITSLRYRNGVFADTRNGRVFRYGIYRVRLPR